MKNVSFNWNNLIHEVEIYTTDRQFITVSGDAFNWSLVHQYYSCQLLDLFDYFDMDTITPKQIFFNFNKVDNVGVTLLIEERNKVVSRSEKYLRSMYIGPSMTFNNLANIIHKSYVHIISTSKDSDIDPNIKCKNYPYKKYKSYKDCDDEFILQEVLKIGLVPFWATDDYRIVTKKR